eukprot:476780_1
MYQSIKGNNGKYDSLDLANSNEIKELIENEGLANEHIIFSNEIKKLNAKGKKQARILLITNFAIYNLKKKKLNKSQRRVCIWDIGMITLSALSPEFAIHVPSEYDYHFISNQKDEITEILQDIYFKETKSKLLVVYSQLKHLKDIILTKKLAKFESRNSKHAMQQTITDMKDVLKGIDNDQIDENIENEEDEMMVKYGIIYSPPIDDDDEENEKQNVAVFQSLVYGNDQLLMQQNNTHKVLQQSR